MAKRYKHVVIVANRTQGTVEKFGFTSKVDADDFRAAIFKMARETEQDVACTSEDLQVTGKG